MAHAPSQTVDSQPQQTGSGPFADAFKKLADEQVARAATLFDELGQLEAASLAQAQATVRELARLTQESIAYTGRLTAEWRRLTLDAARAGGSFLKPRA
jgi:hypothetical protein